MPDPLPDFQVAFRSSALGPEDLFLRELRGREGISRLYEFELVVETTSGLALEFSQMDAMIAGAAYVAFGADEDYRLHGVVRRIQLVSMGAPSPVLYRLLFVPRLYDLTLTQGSWVYQDMTVPEIVADVLKEAGHHADRDFEFRLTGAYPRREYVVQYQETDLQFVSRLMEHAGIYYTFEHGDDRARLVITDTNQAAPTIDDGMEVVGYAPHEGLESGRETVTALELAQSIVPRHVGVQDYNYRTPAVPMVGDTPVDGALGAGLQVYYGEHFKDPAEGKRLARVRAEELLARKYTVTGRSRVRGLRAGQRFELAEHYVGVLNGQYLVTGVTHVVTQAPGASLAAPQRAYENEFTAIPFAVPYRPPRVTPRPRIYGVAHATIDAAVDGGMTAPIDEHGRYKVHLPYDLVSRRPGLASRWVRMAQPSAGGGYGMHFPLHPGVEVLLVHIDGDPDRPVIVGSVPNPHTRSPVTAANATQSEVKSRSGIRITFDDAVDYKFKD